jgi:hypothetical protein
LLQSLPYLDHRSGRQLFMSKKLIIAGRGIGGIAAALALHRISLILGHEIFKRFVIRVNYPRRELSLSLPEAFACPFVRTIDWRFFSA